MKLEVGKDYRTRSGRKIENLQWSEKGNLWATAKGYGDQTWYTQHNTHNYAGDYANTRAGTHDKRDDDIVALWDEPESVASGIKYDTGKPIAGIIFEDFPSAINGVCIVGTFGANKYARGNWKLVENAKQRYSDAMVRHMISKGQGEITDQETGLPHSHHIAWNALAIAEIESWEKADV